MGKQIKTIDIVGNTFRLNEQLVSSIPYLIGVNVADRGGDKSTIVIVDPQSMRTSAVYKSEYINIEGLREILSELVSRVIPNSIICVVRNSTGLILLDNIIRSGDTSKQRLYYEDGGIIKRYGVNCNKTHAIVDLNAIVCSPNVDIDDVLAIAAATYVYNRNTKKTINKVSVIELYKTKNQSFIDMAHYLKNNGVKNYKFMMEIKNKNLEWVDPYDPNLLESTQKAIIDECIENPWYFFREVLRVKTVGNEKTQFKLNKGNTAMMWLFFKGVDTLTYLSTGSYKTTTALALVAYNILFHSDTKTIIGSLRTDVSISLLYRINELCEQLPDYIQLSKKVSYSRGDAHIEITSNNSNVKVWQIHENKFQTTETSRSVNATVQLFDDIDFIENFEEFFKSSSMQYSVIRDYAKNNGKHAARIMTSVPGDLDTKSARFANKLFNSAALFYEEMYDLTDDALATYINTMSKTGIIAINMNWLELGNSQEWYEEYCNRLGNNEDVIRRLLFLDKYAGKNDKGSKKDDNIQIDISLSKSMKEKLFEMAKCEGVTVEMLINQILAMEIGKFNK